MRASLHTRDRIVEAARGLFWEKGFAATGMSELLQRAEANSGSFYYFFESKDALLREVLKTYVELLEPQLLRRAFEERDPLERVFALLGIYRAALLRTGNTYGCPIGRLALEIDPENTPAHALIEENFGAWRKAVEGCLREAGVPEAKAAACLVLAAMEGGVMQARAQRSIAPFDACVGQLRRFFRKRGKR